VISGDTLAGNVLLGHRSLNAGRATEGPVWNSAINAPGFVIHFDVKSATRSFKASGRYGSIPMRSLTAPRIRCLQPR
jgi:hypothetical protein